ncbi:hypothetical protein IC582_029910 [Cucumis melo]
MKKKKKNKKKMRPIGKWASKASVISTSWMKKKQQHLGVDQSQEVQTSWVLVESVRHRHCLPTSQPHWSSMACCQCFLLKYMTMIMEIVKMMLPEAIATEEKRRLEKQQCNAEI